MLEVLARAGPTERVNTALDVAMITTTVIAVRAFRAASEFALSGDAVLIVSGWFVTAGGGRQSAALPSHFAKKFAAAANAVTGEHGLD